MGEISPKRGKNVDPEQFAQFKLDLELLLDKITQEELGKAMSIARSNINSYVKGTLPITKAFLAKFYKHWSHRLNVERSTPDYIPPQPIQDKTEEPSLSEIMTILRRIESKLDRQSGQPEDEN